MVDELVGADVQDYHTCDEGCGVEKESVPVHDDPCMYISVAKSACQSANEIDLIPKLGITMFQNISKFGNFSRIHMVIS
jgi:hypothetical protein